MITAICAWLHGFPHIDRVRSGLVTWRVRRLGGRVAADDVRGAGDRRPHRSPCLGYCAPTAPRNRDRSRGRRAALRCRSAVGRWRASQWTPNGVVRGRGWSCGRCRRPCARVLASWRASRGADRAERNHFGQQRAKCAGRCKLQDVLHQATALGVAIANVCRVERDSNPCFERRAVAAGPKMVRGVTRLTITRPSVSNLTKISQTCEPASEQHCHTS